MNLFKKGLSMDLVTLVVSVIVVVILVGVWYSFAEALLPNSGSEQDKQSILSFQIISKDIEKLKLDGQSEESPYELKGNTLFFLNSNEATTKIKEKNQQCSERSCLCLCQDEECNSIIKCNDFNQKFTSSTKITNNKGILRIAYVLESHRPWIKGLVNYSLSDQAFQSAMSSEIANQAILKMMGK